MSIYRYHGRLGTDDALLLYDEATPDRATLKVFEREVDDDGVPITRIHQREIRGCALLDTVMALRVHRREREGDVEPVIQLDRERERQLQWEAS